MTGIGLVVLWIAIAINSLDVKAAESILKYLTYMKLGALALVAVIGFVFAGKGGAAAHDNFSNAFANSGLLLFHSVLGIGIGLFVQIMQ